jgi:hypothetical protein
MKKDLFDFNVEVVPPVQKAIAQASMKVAEELELEQMQTYLCAFEQKARPDAEAIARLENVEAKNTGQSQWLGKRFARVFVWRCHGSRRR